MKQLMLMEDQFNMFLTTGQFAELIRPYVARRIMNYGNFFVAKPLTGHLSKEWSTDWRRCLCRLHTEWGVVPGWIRVIVKRYEMPRLLSGLEE